MALVETHSSAVWNEQELQVLGRMQPAGTSQDSASNKHNPTPGTGRTGFMNVPPNNYPFYSEDEKYIAVMQADGGQLSGAPHAFIDDNACLGPSSAYNDDDHFRNPAEWTPMYNPTPEQAEADRKKAYEAGIPHGFVQPGNSYKGLPTLPLQVVSELHKEHEYGDKVGNDGTHSGGPFWIDVSPKMRVEDLRKVIRDKGGILPGLQRLSYAGKNMEDSQRTLEHYGVSYWHKSFPNWPIKIRRY